MAGFLDICGCLLYDHHQLRVGVHASFCLALHPRRNPQQKSNYDKNVKTWTDPAALHAA